MKVLFYFLIIIFTNLITAQNSKIHIFIEHSNDGIFEFKKSSNFDYGVLKVQIADAQKDSTKPIKVSSKDIMLNEPTNKNIYEFQSLSKPIIVNSIDSLEVYSIIDVSENIYPISKVWTEYYTIAFIEKVDCSFLIWDMVPIYKE